MMFKKITNLFLFFLFLFVQRGITQDGPENPLSGEKRKLIDENERLKILLEFKDRQILELKNKFEKEINTKNAIINDYRKSLLNERKKSAKYSKDLTKYRDSLNLVNQQILFLNSVIQQHDRDLEELRNQNKSQQKTIEKLLSVQDSLRTELDLKKKEIDAIDFYTSLRVYNFRCIDHTSDYLSVKFFLSGTTNPSLQGPQPVQIQMRVMKKTFMRGTSEILKGKNSSGVFVNDLPIFCTTEEEIKVDFVTKGQIEEISKQTGEYCNYFFEIKIAFKNYVIYEKLFSIEDLSKCGSKK